MEVVPYLTEAQSILLAVVTYLVYIPEVPFMTGHLTELLGCDLTAIVMIAYLVGSFMVMVDKDVANGLIHAFAAALGWVTNHLVCSPADLTKDLVLLSR